MPSKSLMGIVLLTQPGDGIIELLRAIEGAETTIHIVIFRFDLSEIEAALKRAVKRGVFVHALVTYTMAGQGGDASLRKLEMRLLSDGITVSRTATDLVRYHNKLLMIDSKTVFVMGFNFTSLDIDRSRSFGIISTDPAWIEEAEKLFAADTTRQPYSPSCESFVVSPSNSRQQLMDLLSAAQSQLLIYEGKLSDPEAMRILAVKVRAGLDVRVIGAAGKRAIGVKIKRPFMRLHARVIICDGKHCFIGSQSLRGPDLDERREVGVVVEDAEIISAMVSTFESDWARVRDFQAPADALPWEQSVQALEVESDEVSGNGTVPPMSMRLMRSVVKDAIKDAILEMLPENMEAMALKDAVKGAAREALCELAA